MSVEVDLVPPGGTLLPTGCPVALFTMSPPVANINETVTFDASPSTGRRRRSATRVHLRVVVPVPTSRPSRGKVATRAFTVPGSVPVTLYVTDDRGGTSSTSRSLTVTGPAAPERHLHRASVVADRRSQRRAQRVGFHGWDRRHDHAVSMGLRRWHADGRGSSSAVNHTWATAGSYAVIPDGHDSLGRTDSQLSVVTVQ
jgi:hypothetical protein